MTSPADLDAECPPMPDVGLGPQSASFIRDWNQQCIATAYRAGLEAAAKFCEDSELPRGDLLADQIRALKDRVHG